MAAPNGRYILLTTRKWSQPLEQGEYVLHLGDTIELAGSNYFLEKLGEARESRYSFTKVNFFPDKDWIFSWKAAVPLVASRREPQ